MHKHLYHLPTTGRPANMQSPSCLCINGIHICTYIYIHTYTHTHVTYTYIYIYIHTHTCIHVYTCMYVYIYIYVCFSIDVYTYIYIYIYIQRERGRKRDREIPTLITYIHLFKHMTARVHALQDPLSAESTKAMRGSDNRNNSTDSKQT